MGSEHNRFPQQQQQPPAPRHKRWGKCWGGMSCFGTQKGGKRVVPASRMPEGNAMVNHHQAANGTQAAAAAAVVGLLANHHHHQATTALLAPPSSPASFSNSALPSTAQSPNCFLSLSANSPGGPSSSMFATGPYANETQLVSPPVFSTFTTEPSTAPFTPPPELAHVTTPSSPDVPFAQFLSSSNSNSKAGTGGKRNYITGGGGGGGDLQATYSLYPGSPASSLISPVSMGASGGGGDCLSEREFSTTQWDPSIPSCQDSKHHHHHHHPRSDSFGLDTESASKLAQDSNFFCPETFAQFYLDNSSFPHSGGRLSVSKESDVYGNGHHHQNRQNKTSKQQDVEELEAYRASFGFSADEIITTSQYVEISDVSEESFTMRPFASNKGFVEEAITAAAVLTDETRKSDMNVLNPKNIKSNISEVAYCQAPCTGFEESGGGGGVVSGGGKGCILSDEEESHGKMVRSSSSNRKSRKYGLGLSSSDAEIEYGRRERNSRHNRGDLAWHE